MKIKNWKFKSAFTFIELLVVIIIISILWTISFYSYIWYIADSRDSQRKSDLAKIVSALKIYKQKRWYYSLPWNNFNITYSWSTIALQWYLNTSIRLNSLDILPFDPKLEKAYLYSVTTDKQEFEIWATLENEDNNIALVLWNYKSVSINILPAILFATWITEWADLEIQSWSTIWDENRKLFIYDKQDHNLPYVFKEPYNSYSDWTSFINLLNEVQTANIYWQNTDFRNCTEIDEWWKLILPLDSNSFEYQIMTDTWALVNTWCTL